MNVSFASLFGIVANVCIHSSAAVLETAHSNFRIAAVRKCLTPPTSLFSNTEVFQHESSRMGMFTTKEAFQRLSSPAESFHTEVLTFLSSISGAIFLDHPVESFLFGNAVFKLLNALSIVQ